MAVTVESFKVRFPEFAKSPEATVQAALDDAANRLVSGVWGDDYDTGHAYLAAHYLANSPFGRNAKLVTGDGATLYLSEYRRLQKSVVGIAGFSV